MKFIDVPISLYRHSLNITAEVVALFMAERASYSVSVLLFFSFRCGRLFAALRGESFAQRRNFSHINFQSRAMASPVGSHNYLAEFVGTLDSRSSIQIISHDEIPPNSLIVKSLVWTYHKTNPVLVVLDLACSVDKSKLAKHLQLNHVKHLRMATPEQVLSTTGQEVGNVSPIGHIQPVRTIVDQSLLDLTDSARYDSVIMYGGGGSSGFELKLSLQDLLEYAKPEVADIRSVKGTVQESMPEVSCSDKVDLTASVVVPTYSPTESFSDTTVHTAQIATLAKQIRDLAIQKEGFAQLLPLLQSLHSAYNIVQPELLCTILNTGTTTSGKTALHLASWKGSIETVRLLIQYGADVNAYSIGSGNYGKTAIFYAITQCRDDIVAELLLHGASVKIVNNKGQTPRSLGPSHLAEDTICWIERQELSDQTEWLNFYTTHYCDTNTCFGDLDPRFQATTSNKTTENAVLDATTKLPLPRSINTTTFEFRRNHFKSYTKKVHHIDDLVVSLLRTDKPITEVLGDYIDGVDCTTIYTHSQEPCQHADATDHAYGSVETFVGYVASVSTCQDAIARVVPITQFIHLHTDEKHSHSHTLKWTVESRVGDAAKHDAHKRHYESLQLHYTPSSPLPGLHGGDILMVKGALHVTNSSLICTPTNIMVFHPSITDPLTPYSSKGNNKALKKAAKAKRAEKSKLAAVMDDVDVTVITAEATLTDVTDSFVPLHTSEAVEMGTNNCTTEHSASDMIDNVKVQSSSADGVPVLVVDSTESIHKFNRDIQCILDIAHKQNDPISSLKASNDVPNTLADNYIAANPSRLYTIVGLDCEWRPGETYLRYLERQKTRARGEETAASVEGSNDVNDSVKTSVSSVEEGYIEEEDDEYRVAILQIATRTGVYLLDMQELTTCMFKTESVAGAAATDGSVIEPVPLQQQELPPTLSQLNHSLAGLFASPHILKLGFKVAPDFEKLAASYPFMSCFMRIQSVVDTCTVAQMCVPGYVKQGLLPAYWMSNHRLKQLSLTKLLAMVLDGKGLSKEQQCSRWHLRPLTPAQISYAALDAASLLTIFDFFTMRDFPVQEGELTERDALFTETLMEHKLYRTFFSSLKYHIAGSSGSNGSEVPIFTGPGMVVRSLLGVQIAAQSWSLLQEEPLDYAVYAQQQAALQADNPSGDKSSIKNRKGKNLSETFEIAASVTDYINAYRRTLSTEVPRFSYKGTESSPGEYVDFLGMYISSSKDTCVEFVQALLKQEQQSNGQVVQGNRSAENSGDSYDGGGVSSNDAADAGPVVSKVQNGMVLVENTMVIFVNFPASTNNYKSVATDKSDAASATDSLFLCNGEYVKWTIDVPLLVRENSNRVSTVRSLLLHNLVSETHGKATECTSKEGVKDSILLFVRQNAAPYVFCGKVSVSSILTLLPTTPTIHGVNNVGTSVADPAMCLDNSAVKSSNTSVSDNGNMLEITLQVLQYNALFTGKPSEDKEVEGDTPIYKSMILRAIGAA